jgi:hypothetical protein
MSSVLSIADLVPLPCMGHQHTSTMLQFRVSGGTRSTLAEEQALSAGS